MHNNCYEKVFAIDSSAIPDVHDGACLTNSLSGIYLLLLRTNDNKNAFKI